ncbi:MAG: hypothetical protein PHO92_05095, partial [Candidatus Peribacteraceae bacterium]|nr:hypothetical protein [Candidatus Peribacteraceae bacterium]
TLYDEMRMMTEYDQQDFVSELPIQRFAPLVLGDEKFPAEEKHVDLSLQKKYATVCEDIAQATGNVWISECQGFAEQLNELARKEAWIRALGRELQLIASSYEPEMDGHTGRENAIATKLPGATLLWQSGTDRMTNPVDQVRIKRLELPDTIKPHVQSIEGMLGGMVVTDNAGETQKKDYGELVAALFRYRNGYQEVQMEGKSAEQLAKEEDDPESFTYSCRENAENRFEGTDLQMLGKRWCDLEREMHNIWQKLPKEDFVDLGPKDTAVFPVKGLGVPGMSDAVLWVKRDDVGILWRMPLEPVLPMLDAEGTPVLSGIYPEPPAIPDPKHGICSHPFAQRGYLCRKQLVEHCPIQGEEFDEGDRNKITLAACKPYASPILETESGPDICQRGGWRTPIDPEELKKDTPAEDGNKLSPGPCANCVVDLFCKDISGGATYTKTPEGIIPIAITKHSIMDPRYIIIHELIHAQQLCNSPPGTEFNPLTSKEVCCEREYLPYLISCKATAEDGLLDTTSISVEECASILANDSCSQWEYACTGPPADEAAYQERKKLLAEALKDENAPSCEEAINTIDGRALSIKESLKQSCRPGCEAQYENTIGNNLCYIGQCIEESLEEHRLIPGRIPYVTQDEAFPWDSCMNEDPQLATFVTVPPLTRTFLPVYKGQELLQQLDTLLCQMNGLPRLSPPILCAFSPGKRISLPLQTYFNTALSLVEQDKGHIDDTANLQESVGNIATRIGTTLYREYLEKALREFSELIRAAGTFGRQMGEVEFPTVACPRNHTGDCEIFRK